MASDNGGRRGDGEAARFDRMMAPLDRYLLASRAWVAARADGDVLEVAAGTGLNLPYYGDGVRLTALELNPAMLRSASAKAASGDRRVSFVVGDGHRLPFLDGSFDAVVCTFSLCGFPDHERGIGEMVRVLRPGGSLLLADHVGSTNRGLLAAQRLLEAATIPLRGEHFTRRPRLAVERADVEIVEADRLHHGIVERLHAVRRD